MLNNQPLPPKSSFFFLVAATTVILMTLLLGPILREGMFLDGLVYSSIARNMAEGVGSFWSPVFSPFEGVFYEQPPLLPYLQSLLYRLLGHHLLVEDVYNFLVLTLTLFLIYRIWRLLFPDYDNRLAIFPLLLFLLNQEVQLRYPNTMLESGMTAIILLTVYAYFLLQKRGQIWLALMTVGLGTWGSFLAKGPAGLFPLSLPVVHYWLVQRRFSLRALLLPASTFVLGIGALVTIFPEAKDFLSQYFDQQVLAAIQGERLENVAEYRLEFVVKLLMANLPALVLLGICFAIGRKKGVQRKPLAWVLLITGALAVIPLVISQKQAAYYQLPAIPFLALGAAAIASRGLEQLLNYPLSRGIGRLLLGLATSLVTIGLVMMLKIGNGIDRRDREIIIDVNHIGDLLATQPTLGETGFWLVDRQGNAPVSDGRYYRFIAYLNRYLRLYHNPTGTAKMIIKLPSEGAIDPTERTILTSDRFTVEWLGED